ncbi:MAG: sugar ABC transporter permease [Lachnospiraceae bacterium]|jgi:multiple sugar transport system permease protein|nr:sugar ABC transporter permease [Lachnospiraceae bacterium]
MKKKNHLDYSKYGYIFCIPFTVAFLIFSLYPILYTAIIGFTDLKGMGATSFHFLSDPFKNFRMILNNHSFRVAFGNTFKIWILNFIPQIFLALLLTAWFTDKRNKIKGQGLFKVLFYMPNIITAATVAILFGALLGYPMGPINDLFMQLGINSKPVEFLRNKGVAQGSIAFIQFWMWYGYTMLILISGVLGINPEIFEAAEVDGANRVQTFFMVTLPNIKTILLFTLVTSLIGGLNMFDIPKLFIQSSGPDNATLTTSVFIYNQAFSGSYLYNRASAASMIMFVIICILSGIMFYFMRDKDQEALDKQIRQQEKAYAKKLRAERKAAG